MGDILTLKTKGALAMRAIVYISGVENLQLRSPYDSRYFERHTVHAQTSDFVHRFEYGSIFNHQPLRCGMDRIFPEWKRWLTDKGDWAAWRTLPRDGWVVLADGAQDGIPWPENMPKVRPSYYWDSTHEKSTTYRDAMADDVSDDAPWHDVIQPFSWLFHWDLDQHLRGLGLAECFNLEWHIIHKRPNGIPRERYVKMPTVSWTLIDSTGMYDELPWSNLFQDMPEVHRPETDTQIPFGSLLR